MILKRVQAPRWIVDLHRAMRPLQEHFAAQYERERESLERIASYFAQRIAERRNRKRKDYVTRHSARNELIYALLADGKMLKEVRREVRGHGLICPTTVQGIFNAALRFARRNSWPWLPIR